MHETPLMEGELSPEYWFDQIKPVKKQFRERVIFLCHKTVQ